MLADLALALALVVAGINLAPALLAPQPQEGEILEVELMLDVPDPHVKVHRDCAIRHPHPVYRDLSNVPLIHPPSAATVPNHHP